MADCMLRQQKCYCWHTFIYWCKLVFMLCYEFVDIYKRETNEIFNTMIGATLQVINKVNECLTLYYRIRHCSIFRCCYFWHEVVWILTIVKYSYCYFIM